MSTKEVIISTGNILEKAINFNNAVEELCESLRSCLEEREVHSEVTSSENSIEILPKTQLKIEGGEDRNDLKISAKLFLSTGAPEEISRALLTGLKEAGVDYFDTVVLSLGLSPLTLEKLQSSWSILEGLLTQGKAKMIGLADVESAMFMSLWDIVEIKPAIVQINLATCCVVPPELSEFCKARSIQLLTHSDPINILPQEKLEVDSDLGTLLKGIISPGETAANGNVGSNWVVRYQVHLKMRGVLAAKGFVTSVSL